MAERLEHIPLNRVATFKRRKRKGGRRSPYDRVERDYDEFRRDVARMLRGLDGGRRKDAERYAQYGYTPYPLFKLNLTQRVPFGGFKKSLEAVDITTISSATGRSGYWVVAGGKDHASKLDRQIEKRAASTNPTFVDAIAAFTEADPQKKLGGSLEQRPIKDDFEPVDVEVWRLGDDALKSFSDQLLKMVMDNGGRITDVYKTRDTFVAQITCDAALLSMLAGLREVVRIDRPLQIEVEDRANRITKKIAPTGSPGPKAPGILVADSGVSMHPLLEPAFGGFVSVDGRDGDAPVGLDDMGHGTGVAGVALYGDIEKCINDKKFRPEVWIYSAKVLEKNPPAQPPFAALLEAKIGNAVRATTRAHPRCRVVNLSLGDSHKRLVAEDQQLRLGGVVDQLSVDHPGIMFTISAGNNIDNMDRVGPYPDYLLSDAKEVRLIDPATSAHAITVGALSRPLVGVGYPSYPAPETCVGPGLASMIKPDVVEFGGGYHGPGSRDVLTLNMGFARDGRMFTTEAGTSMSAPAVAHMLAMLQMNMPKASRNLLKALVISSAEIPAERPDFSKQSAGSGRPDRTKLLRIYGYGQPNLDRAAYSRPNKALFVYEGKIGLEEVALFAVYVPEAFMTGGSRKIVEVTLAYDPPIDRMSEKYFGVGMEYHLYKNVSLDTVRSCYEDLGEPGSGQLPSLASIEHNLLDLFPRITQRKKCLHQKSWNLSQKLDINTEHPLVLAVTSANRWVETQGYEQDFALALALGHSEGVGLYAALRSANAAQIRGGIGQ